MLVVQARATRREVAKPRPLRAQLGIAKGAEQMIPVESMDQGRLWVFFRAPTFADALAYLSALFTNFEGCFATEAGGSLVEGAIVGVVLALSLSFSGSGEEFIDFQF